MTTADFKVKFPITMLGASGVGKTSMIAAMWNEFDRVCSDPRLQLIPDAQTGDELDQRLIELKRMAAGAPGIVDCRNGIKGDMEERDYELTMHHTESRAGFDIIFRDYPGGWLSPNSRKGGQVTEKLRSARIILIAVDVPSLMTHPEHVHEERNRPGMIAGLLSAAFQQHNEDCPNRLVLFTLMRGERWLRRGEGQALLAQLEARYQRTFRALGGRDQEIAVAVCPIQTLGAVEFRQFNAQEQPIFEKVRDETYRPVDCDQPLRYVLNYVTNQLRGYAEAKKQEAQATLDKRSRWTKWRHRCMGLFGIKSEMQQNFDNWLMRADRLRSAVELFANGLKEDSPFVITQNPGLLTLRQTRRNGKIWDTKGAPEWMKILLEPEVPAL